MGPNTCCLVMRVPLPPNTTSPHFMYGALKLCERRIPSAASETASAVSGSEAFDRKTVNPAD